ncbi:MAG: ATP synthase F1 subunit delta [Candidatus Omnitrophica bacterium]|nr:ATP synthase F1 subunit delta [Candidatus Omnitrophota bacterium]MDE2009711.1 ATP synthase F1 subunit delta [Candidatus Omnitrophota bacterium]MDE2213892.1 ATP synthase F1 subunit delta [Candidatus Omnitrophota bacterium]MDE2231849.1 ATP synthase F1 subunit delta [Candidatus Omnitrophota bacterium]
MSRTADRYAKAIFELAREQNILEAVQESMTEIRTLIITLEGFRRFLGNPLLSYEERRAVLTSLFEGKIPELALRALLFITYKNRLPILRDIIESFDSLYLAGTGTIRAYIRTALPITDQDKALIDGQLHDKFRQRMLTRWSVDGSLIGGFRIFIQGVIYDYSFKNQLNHFLQL